MRGSASRDRDSWWCRAEASSASGCRGIDQPVVDSAVAVGRRHGVILATRSVNARCWSEFSHLVSAPCVASRQRRYPVRRANDAVEASTRSQGPPPAERSGSPGIRCHGGHPRLPADRGSSCMPLVVPLHRAERRGTKRGRSKRGRDAQCGADAEGLWAVERDEPIEVTDQLNRERLGEARGLEACHDARPCEERWCP